MRRSVLRFWILSNFCPGVISVGIFGRFSLKFMDVTIISAHRGKNLEPCEIAHNLNFH